MTHGVRSQLARTIGPDWQWVAPQLVMLGAIVVALPLTARRRERRSRRLRLLAIPLLLTSAWVAGKAYAELSPSVTMSPTPVADGELKVEGLYGVIRHPMYLSVLLFIAGYATAWDSRLGTHSLVATILFLCAKVRHEERALAERYPDYERYSSRVRWRFLPGVV
ncbi:MAG TPA: isoprenylcysteine carboxylmethyltransferase family protein [Thermomicrobiales bacterium]|nr:isoprenylcysteine carboxylmethyltransferase family protein [Thermomicrobiales bacterium]